MNIQKKFLLPTFKVLQWVKIALVLVLLFGLIKVSLNLVKNRGIVHNAVLLGQENAIWSESIFFKGYNPSTLQPLTDQYIRNFANQLKDNNIKYAYIFGGPFQKDGHLPGYIFSDTAKHSIQRLKELYPGLVVLPWIGGLENKTLFLHDSLWIKNAIADCKKVVPFLGVTGLHLDFEYIIPGIPSLDAEVAPNTPEDMAAYPGYVNAFFKQLRDTLPHAFISTVVTSTCPASVHWKRKTTVAELTDLVPYVDQLNFLFYDTAIDDTTVYRKSAELLMKDIQYLKRHSNAQMLVSIATFTNPVQYERFHNLKVENIPNALETIKKAAIKISPNEKILSGISIFCNWETSRHQWKDINKHYTTFANDIWF